MFKGRLLSGLKNSVWYKLSCEIVAKDTAHLIGWCNSTVHRLPSTVCLPISASPTTVHSLPSSVYHPLFTIHHLPSTVQHQQSTDHRLPTSVYHPLSAIHFLPSTVFHPASTAHNHSLQSTNSNLPFTVYYPPPTVHRLPTAISSTSFPQSEQKTYTNLYKILINNVWKAMRGNTILWLLLKQLAPMVPRKCLTAHVNNYKRNITNICWRLIVDFFGFIDSRYLTQKFLLWTALCAHKNIVCPTDSSKIIFYTPPKSIY